MKENPFSEIITERLLLRKPKKTDWKMVSHLRSNEEINKFITRSSATSQTEALEFIEKIRTGIQKQEIFYWSITEKNNDQMIGSICLWNFSADRKTAETGYDLLPYFQKKGIMSEALQSILDYGFLKLHLQKIEAYTHKDNIASKKMLESNNFKLVPGKKDAHNANNLIFSIEK